MMSSYLVLDGEALNGAASYGASLAAGYYILLRPLPYGDRDAEFSGRFFGPFDTHAQASSWVREFTANASLRRKQKDGVPFELVKEEHRRLAAEMRLKLLDPLAALAMDLHAIEHSPLASDEQFPLAKVNGAHRLLLDTVQSLHEIVDALDAAPLDDLG